MEVKETGIEGLIEIEPRLLKDDRGYFFESYNDKVFEKILPGVKFVQDNQSYSIAGVLRGLHFQRAPFAQGKLVRVVMGRVLDAVVDIREGSPTYGEHRVFELTAERCNMVYVPEGFAHGFVTLEPSIFSYKCTNFYDRESEGGIIWNDPDLKIDWQVEAPLVSEKDQVLGRLRDL